MTFSVRHATILWFTASTIIFGRLHAEWSWVVPTQHSDISPDLFVKGIRQAEQFRRNLLRKNAMGITPAEILAEGVLRFQKLAAPHLAMENNVKGFRIKSRRIVQRIGGTKIKVKPGMAFKALEGKWLGQWGQKEVKKHRYVPIHQAPPKRVEGFHPVWVHSVQCTRMHDGIAWSVLASTEEKSKAFFFLKTIYRWEDEDLRDDFWHQPAVGVWINDTRYIWVAGSSDLHSIEEKAWNTSLNKNGGEIRLEAHLNPKKAEFERFASTGFYYQMRGQQQMTVRGNSFQVIYAKPPATATTWKQFWINFSSP